MISPRPDGSLLEPLLVLPPFMLPEALLRVGDTSGKKSSETGRNLAANAATAAAAADPADADDAS